MPVGNCSVLGESACASYPGCTWVPAVTAAPSGGPTSSTGSMDAGATGGGLNPGGNADAGSPAAASPASPTPGCIRFEACVDGADLVSVQDGLLSIEHQSFEPMGKHADCSTAVSTINPAISLQDATDGRFVIDGQPYPLSALPLQVSIANISSCKPIQGRGSVSQPAPNRVLIDDYATAGPTVYVLDLCQ